MDTTLRELAIIANEKWPNLLRAGLKVLGFVMQHKGYSETAAGLETLSELSVGELREYLKTEPA